MYRYDYLNDTKFLQELTESKIKEQYVKITVLDWDEHILQQITGKTLGGSINVDGTSAMRRTASIQLIADETNNNLTNIDNIISLNKKVELQIGIKNITNKYIQYPMFWFPQGIFLIVGVSIEHSPEGVKINLTLHDKMALLNGECGGVLPAPITFSEMEDEDSFGNTLITNPTMASIIKELMVHWGGEQQKNLEIKDLDGPARQVLRWCGQDEKDLNYFFIDAKNVSTKNLTQERYQSLKSLNTSVPPSIEEDQFYENLLQSLIQKAFSNDSHYNSNLFPLSKDVVRYYTETATIGKIAEMRNIIYHLDEISKNSQELLNNLKTEKALLKSTKNTIIDQITTKPHDFQKALMRLCDTVKNFYEMKWHNAYLNGFYYPDNKSEKKDFRKAIQKNCRRVNWLKPQHRNKKDIEELISILKTLKQRITYVKNQTGKFVDSHQTGTKKEWEQGKQKKDNKKYYIYGRTVIAYLLDFGSPNKNSYYGEIKLGKKSLKEVKHYMENNNPYYFYNDNSNMGIFIRGNNMRSGARRINFGTINYNIKNNKAKIVRITTNIDVNSKQAFKKLYNFKGSIWHTESNSWWSSQLIFANQIASLKKENSNKKILAEKIDEFCNYRVLKELQKCLDYIDPKSRSQFENILVENLISPFRTAQMGSRDATTLCTRLINFVDFMLTKIEKAQEDYNYNIKTYTYMRTKAFNDKIFNSLDSSKKDKITFSERINEEIKELKELADKLARNFEMEMTLPGFFYWKPKKRDSQGNVVSYIRYRSKPKLTNLRDIGKYMVNNSGIFSELKNKTTDGVKTPKKIKENHICSISQICNNIKSQLQNYNFQEHNMTYAEIMNDIHHIISYYDSKGKQSTPHKSNYWSVRDIYYKYYNPFLKGLKEPDHLTKERQELLKQKKIIEQRLKEIEKNEKSIPQACNNVLKQWCKKNLSTFLKIQEKLVSKTSKETTLSALRAQSKLLNSYYKKNNFISMPDDIRIINKHLSAIGNAKDTTNLIQSSLKLNPKAAAAADKETLKNKQTYIQYSKDFQSAQKRYAQNVKKLQEQTEKILVQLSINEQQIRRLEDEILEEEKELEKNVTKNAEQAIAELNKEIEARKQNLKTLIVSLKEEKVTILKDFFKNNKEAYGRFFTSLAKAAYKKDLSKNEKSRKWYKTIKKDSENDLNINNNYIIYNTLFNDPAIKTTTGWKQNSKNRDAFWKNFYWDLCVPAYKYGIKQYRYGEDIGYTLTDFTYPGELTCNAGDTISSVLDKIKNALGNYEYYYDINGHFVFQEIHNYLNTSYSTYLSQQLSQSNADFTFNYFSQSPISYDFSNGTIVQSYQNSPQYQQIKNDFLIWGERETVTGQKIPIRYHLAIDSPPSTNLHYFFDAPKAKIKTFQYKTDLPTRPEYDSVKKEYKFSYVQEQNCFYKWIEDKSGGYTGYKKMNLIIDNPDCIYKTGNFPTEKEGAGKQGKYYYNQDTGILYQWDKKNKKYSHRHTFRIQVCAGLKPKVGIIGNYYYDNNNKIYLCTGPKQTDFMQLKDVDKLKTVNCIGTALYLEGYQAEVMGIATNDYYTELKTEWPKVWNLSANKMYDNVKESITSIDYFLNFINSSNLTSKFSISSIGKRSHIISNSAINCIFEPECPDIVFFDDNPPVEENQPFSMQTLQREDYNKKTKVQKKNDLKLYNNIHASNYLERFIDHSIFQYFRLGGKMRSAYEEIRSQLYQFITYNEQVSINILPMHYLQPNIIIKLKDIKTGINGNFLVKSFSIPLDINSNMSLTCTKAITRI